MFAHTIEIIELPPDNTQSHTMNTHSHTHTSNGSSVSCLFTVTQSPDSQKRFTAIAELCKKQSQNCVCAKNAFDSLMKDKNITVSNYELVCLNIFLFQIITELYDKMAQICETNDFLQETSILRLMENIWVIPRLPLFAKTALSKLIKSDKKYRGTFGNRVSAEKNYENVFDMIHFAKTHIPSHAQHLEKVETHSMIEMLKTIPNKKIILEVFQNLNPYFEFFDFFEKLLDAFAKKQVNEKQILKFVKLHTSEEHLKKVPHYLRMLIDVVGAKKFDSIFKEIIEEFGSRISQETLKKFKEDVRDVMMDCSEHQFMRMMENVYIKEKRSTIVDVLFSRMDILDSDCETMRTRFAMTLLRNAYAPKLAFRTKQSIIIRYILKYTYREIPKQFNTCVVSLRNAKMAITMIHYFVESFENFSKQSNNVEEELKKLLTGFREILTKFIISSINEMACEITRGIIWNIACVMNPAKPECNLIPPFLDMAQKIAGFKDAQDYIDQGSYMRIRDGLFYNQ